jgi:capsular exopolysaccharide synthesis family protein
VSRIFQALGLAEKANGRGAPGNSAGSAEKWTDLRASLEAWSTNEAQKTGEPSSKPKSDVPTGSNPGILESLEELVKAELDKTLSERIGPGEQWKDFAARINLRPGIVEQAEQVTCVPQAEERVLASGQFKPSAQESFRVLCQRLLQVREQRQLRTILVTSPVPGEGKTVVSINLAATLARSSSTVLLVNADLRHSGRYLLGIDPERGLSDYLAGQVELIKSIRRVDPLGFYYMPAGISSANPSELLQKPALQEFMSQACVAFDWVIVDSPSVNLFADSRHLATVVDGVLLVVRENVTPKELAQKSLAALDKAFVVGMVFNASTGSPYAQYDLSEHSHTLEENVATRGAGHSNGKLVGEHSIFPREKPDSGGTEFDDGIGH